VRDDRVRQPRGSHRGDRGEHLRRNPLVEPDVLLEGGLHPAHQRLDLHRGLHLLGEGSASTMKRFGSEMYCRSAPTLALDETFTVPSGRRRSWMMAASVPIS